MLPWLAKTFLVVTIKALFLKLEVLTGIFQTEEDILTSSLLQSTMASRSTFPPSQLFNQQNKYRAEVSTPVSLISETMFSSWGDTSVFLSLPVMAVSWETTLCVFNIMVKALCSHSPENKLSRLVLQMVLWICLDLGHPPSASVLGLSPFVSQEASHAVFIS